MIFFRIRAQNSSFCCCYWKIFFFSSSYWATKSECKIFTTREATAVVILISQRLRLLILRHFALPHANCEFDKKTTF